MKAKDITEQTLRKSSLFTDEEIKFARVYLHLPEAGEKNSHTRNWYRGLGRRRFTKLSKSVDNKINQLLGTEG